MRCAGVMGRGVGMRPYIREAPPDATDEPMRARTAASPRLA